MLVIPEHIVALDTRILAWMVLGALFRLDSPLGNLSMYNFILHCVLVNVISKNGFYSRVSYKFDVIL